MARTCSVPDCDLAVDWHGFCNMHAKRWVRHGDPSVVLPKGWGRRSRPEPKVCAMADCDRQAYARGWCEPHYRRWRLKGTPEFGEPGYSRIHQLLRVTRGLAGDQRCEHCGKRARQWAYDHSRPDPMARTDPTGRPYSLDPQHYLALCSSCHKLFDL